ncbi:DUF3899 domain-containing protein [Bacillus salinus]|uniref:DUF3899 domain-containing protein n=1 Tax=Bacillus sp. HMF5848 TaxID=2495421 RepID=UPI0016394EC5|nr:DUF3899 domain-containing protein [Bacillus sp. HMF5848]
MKFIKLLIIAVLLSFLFMLINAKGFSYISFVNFLFFMSVLYLSVAGMQYVLQTGFMSGIIYSFKRFAKRTNVIEQMIDEEIKYPTFSFRTMNSYFLCGSLLFILSFLISFMI